MEWIIFLVILMIVVGYLFLRIGQSSSRTTYLEEIAGKMTLEESQEAFDESCIIIIRQMSDPVGSGISVKEASEQIERAVSYKNRVNQLTGQFHGPEFRLRYRPKLLMDLKSVSDRIVGN